MSDQHHITVKLDDSLDSLLIAHCIRQAIIKLGLSCSVQRLTGNGCSHGSTAITILGGYADIRLFTALPNHPDATHFDDCDKYETIVLTCAKQDEAIVALIVGAMEHDLHREPLRCQPGELAPS